MFDLLVSVLGGRSPRPVPPEAPPTVPFHRCPRLGGIRGVAAARDGAVWVVGEGGILDLGSGNFLPLLEGESGGLTCLAVDPFLALGGPSGIWLLGGGRLFPVEPRERALRLVSTPAAVLALTRDQLGRLHLRGCRAPGERWHEVHRLPGGALDLASDEGGQAFLLEPDGIRPVSFRGPGPGIELPRGCGAPARLAVSRGQLLLADEEERLWLGAWADASWVELEGRGIPGRDRRGLVVSHASGLDRVTLGGDREPDDREAAESGGILRPAGTDLDGVDLAWTPGAVLRSARGRWRPLLQADRIPTSARHFRRTEAGHLWVVDHRGRVFHRHAGGDWTSLQLPEGLHHDGAALGVDGEALVFSAHDPERDWSPGESLFWVAAPRGREVGTVLEGRPRPVPLGFHRGKAVAAVAALGSDLFVGVGSEVLRVRGEEVVCWGEADGLPGEPVLDLATLFDDLWMVSRGSSGPLRFLRGCLDLEQPGAEGPAGQATALAADNESGQLWVAFEDGEKGGVGSLSREGVWISQLRLPGPARSVAAYGGAVVASCRAGLILLESGERLRRTLGVEQGLPDCGYHALGLVPGEILVDTEEGLYRSLLEVRQEPREEASPGAAPPAPERIEV